jgi:hypothetical protein
MQVALSIAPMFSVAVEFDGDDVVLSLTAPYIPTQAEAIGNWL